MRVSKPEPYEPRTNADYPYKLDRLVGPRLPRSTESEYRCRPRIRHLDIQPSKVPARHSSVYSSTNRSNARSLFMHSNIRTCPVQALSSFSLVSVRGASTLL